jgi:hypothetical protein
MKRKLVGRHFIFLLNEFFLYIYHDLFKWVKNYQTLPHPINLITTYVVYSINLKLIIQSSHGGVKHLNICIRILFSLSYLSSIEYQTNASQIHLYFVLMFYTLLLFYYKYYNFDL